MRIPFGVEAYKHVSLPLSAQRMVNCYLEATQAGAKSPAAVVSSYGVTTWATIGSGSVRGGYVRNDVLYVVIGTTFYSVNSSGGSTNLGTVAGTGYVAMAGDETNIMLVTGGVGYYYNGTTLAQITDSDFPTVLDWVQVIDGYFVVIESGSGRFYISLNRSPSQWDALDFATTEKYPDDLVSGIVDHGELILFGKESTEVWYNSGNADFPLDKAPSGHFEKGAMSSRCVAKLDNAVYFVGNDGIVYRLNGYTPQRVSTHAIEQAIQAATDKNFIGFTWSESGHTFYGLKSTDFAFVYDVSTNLWHERESFGLSSWRWAFVLRHLNEWVVGDATGNRLGRLSVSTYTEFGDTMKWLCTSPSVSKDNMRLTHDRLELVFDNGVGLATGQGSDPQAMLRFSNNGGRTWSSEKWRSLGQIGEYQSRAVWNRMGQARDRIYECSITDPVRRTLILATAEVEQDGY